VLEMAERARWEVTLCAPTGRAAKRLTEATGRPASTIHRLLRPLPGGGFHYDESNPLPAGLLIVDEVSMLDLELADALFAALTIEHRVLLVGDVDQLPSVGPGNILADVIEAADGGINISLVRLAEIFRQASGSSITSNAHRMLRGENLVSDEGKAGQFYMLHAATADMAHRKAVHLAVERIPWAYGLDPVHQVQVLCPGHHGPAGTDAFNSRLQMSHSGREAESFWASGGRRFCVGDRVMQTRNDYERNVFNGDIGTVVELDDSTLTVDFDGANKQYKRYDVRSLKLAYAMTIHKSQGGDAQPQSPVHCNNPSQAALHPGRTERRHHPSSPDSIDEALDPAHPSTRRARVKATCQPLKIQATIWRKRSGTSATSTATESGSVP
jgi:exodeoxyribonuclease V alpha subunit